MADAFVSYAWVCARRGNLEHLSAGAINRTTTQTAVGGFYLCTQRKCLPPSVDASSASFGEGELTSVRTPQQVATRFRNRKRSFYGVSHSVDATADGQ
jgi:hypothetical protein